jgi:hypothetical protein
MKAVIKTLQDLDNLVAKIGKEGLLTGKPMTLTLTKFRRPRTLEQNAKLHAMFRELAEHVGETEHFVKEYMKAEFGPKRVVKFKVLQTNVMAEKARAVPMSTSDYTVDQLNEMIERVYQCGAFAGVQFQERDDE